MATDRVVITAIVLGQQCQNVLHFHNPDGAMDAVSLKEEIRTQWISEIKQLQNTGCVYSQIAIQKNIDTSTPDPITTFPVAGTTGELAGAIAPSFIAGVFSIRTAVSGRHGHGRFYMFGVHQDSILNGVVQSGAFTAYAARAAALTAKYSATGSRPISLVVIPRSDPTDTKTMTTILARPTWGVVRRRNIGVGS